MFLLPTADIYAIAGNGGTKMTARKVTG